ncbi:MAG: Na-translocating system protein MpsC family protein [Solirubrobacteraceae bacterium]|nr:Na-translocating system protein MpsC family protein [Solirubrobacteraceae bacterium]
MPVDDGTLPEPIGARTASGSVASAISRAIVQLIRDYTGRGPNTVRTTIRNNVVLVILEDALTKGERSLVTAGRVKTVIDLRHEFQMAMKEDAIARVSALTGRTVIAMMSTNHVSPDLGAEIFVLDGPVGDGSV